MYNDGLKSKNIKDEIVRYLDEYNKNIRKCSGSYILRDINEELFPELKATNQEEKIYYDTQKRQVSLLKFLMDNNNRNYTTIFLSGEGGMGKTVSMLSSSETLCGLQNKKLLPIYIPLYLLNEIDDENKELLEKYMFDEIWQGDIEVYDFFRRPSNIDGTIVFLLDGFNELKASIITKVAKEIRRLINRNRGRIIISSRDETLLDLPVFYNFGNEIIRLEIQPLKKEQIRKYLKICGMDYPKKNSKLADVLSNPLMLALYANYEVYREREKGIRKHLSWYYSPVNAGQIIWNFLQAQVLKLWFGQENIISSIDSYMAVHFVSAYIGYKMEVSHKFSITIGLLKIWIQELSTDSKLLLSILNDLCASGLEQEFIEGTIKDWRLDEDEILAIIKDRLCLFVSFHEKTFQTEDNIMYSPQKCKIKFMHQQFRDCYAAIYRKKVLSKPSWYLDDAWSKTISSHVLGFCADLFTKEELISVLDKVRGKEFEKDNVVLKNILSICKIIYKNDFSEFDFSGLDLREVYLGGIKMGPYTKFENAKVSYNTFLPEGHEGKVNAISVLKSGKFSVSGGEDKSIILWNLLTSRQEKKFEKKFGNIIGIDSCLRLDEEKENCDFVLLGNKQGKIIEINMKNNIEECYIDVKCGVIGIAYNPVNLKKFAVITEKELLIYDISIKKVCTQISSESKICCGVYSADGTRFFLGLESGEIKGWIVDRKTQIPFISYKGHDVPVTAMAYSSSDNYLVSGSSEGKIIICKIYENIQNQVYENIFIKEIKCDRNIQCIKFFPHSKKNNRNSFIWSTNGTETTQNLVMQYNICSDSKQVLSYHKHLIHDLDFTPDGKRYVTASYDTTVKCWDIDTNLCVGIMQGFNSWIRSISFSPDGRKCVLGSYDNSLKIWDVDNSRCCKTLQGHKHWVRDIEYLSDGSKFVSVSYDKTLRVWEGEMTYQCENVFKRHNKGISGVACSANGEFCVTASYDEDVILWNLNEKDSDKNYRVLKGHQGRVRDVAYSPNEDICVSASYDKTLIVWNCSWNLEGNRIVKVLDDHEDYVRCVTFTPKGDYCISGSYDKTFIVWNTNQWTMKYQSLKFPEWIRCLACSPNGENLLIGCDNGIIYVWDIENNVKLGEMQGHENWIGKVKFFPSGKSCISCSDDNSVKIWSTEKGEKQYKCKNTYQILPYLDLVDCDFRNVDLGVKSKENKLDTILYENGALIKTRE